MDWPIKNFVAHSSQISKAVYVVFVHHERQPKPELGDFHRAGVYVHAVNATLNGMAFEVVGRAVFNIVEARREAERARTISCIMPTGNAPEPMGKGSGGHGDGNAGSGGQSDGKGGSSGGGTGTRGK